MSGWIGVDLDGTLATYGEWKGVAHVGDPVPAMVERVKMWLAAGIEVRIVTARVSIKDEDYLKVVRSAIEDWCKEHIGQVLLVTNEKDFGMLELWDDRAVTVEANTGRILTTQ